MGRPSMFCASPMMPGIDTPNRPKRELALAPKLRILHCIATMEGGGAERQLSYLAPALAERGWDVHLAIIRDGPNRAGLHRAGVQVHILPVRSPYDPRLPLMLLRLVK